MNGNEEHDRDVRHHQLERSGDGLNERLAVHFLKRLRREAERLALADAVEAGILRRDPVDMNGQSLTVYRHGPKASEGMAPELAVAILSRHRRRPSSESPRPILGSSGLSFESTFETFEETTRHDDHTELCETAPSKQDRADELVLVRAIRAAAEPPNASDVATLLLIAQAVADGEIGLRDVLQALRLRRPIVTILCEVKGFERSFLDLLKRGLVLPGAVVCADGYDAYSPQALRFDRIADPRWRIVTFAGHDRGGNGCEDNERQFGNAAHSAFPILSIAERRERLPRKLVQASQLDLACGTPNAAIVGHTIEAVTGKPPSPGRLDGIDFGRLGLGDLAIAIRPGISADVAAETLQRLASEDAGDGSQEPVGKPQPKEKPSSSGSSTTSRGADPGSGTDIVNPVPPSQAHIGHPVPTVESLAGFGEASQWALQVRDELPLWHAGALSWEDLSTKILLSGPPGVGKTLFARALCNTLQIPLLATSVARWLEPSHLGDVIKRIRGAFREAEAHKPCILFIDEFDGIGRRVDFTRDYADYWNTVVNCCLEMLDGAARTSGVIVVCATNNPEVIDPALLRSGRIERRVEIPLPDAAARLAILRHYLGEDAEAVAESVPQKIPEDELRKLLQEGFESMPDDIYRELVAAAIPASMEARPS